MARRDTAIAVMAARRRQRARAVGPTARRLPPPPPPPLCTQAELARIPSTLQRMQRLALYARILAAEALGTVLVAPFALRAISLHRSLPDARRAGGRSTGSVSVLRDVR